MLRSMRSASPSLLFFVVLGLSCSGSGITPGGPGSGNGLGIGADCDPTHTCRTGLKCEEASRKCVPAGTTKKGDPCTIGDECESGSCGPSILSDSGVPGPRTCEDAGAGTKDSTCGGDRDCAKGLRCGFDGASFFPKCIPEGTKDLAQDCTSNKDCLRGLVCNPGGHCDHPPALPGPLAAKGVPPAFPSAWAGATCPAPVTASPVTALFHLPRPEDKADGNFYTIPFPNDGLRNKTTGKVSFANHPHDATSPVGFDAVKLYLDALEDQPFGPYPTIFLRFDGEFEFSSVALQGCGSFACDTPKGEECCKTGSTTGDLKCTAKGSCGGTVVSSDDPQTRLVDVTVGDPAFGTRRGLSILVDSGRNKYICNNYIAVRPPNGDPLVPGHSYAVVIKKGVTRPKAADGSLIVASKDFEAMVAGTAPTDSALADAYNAYKPLRDYLVTAKIAPADVINATVFTVGDPKIGAARLRASVRATDAPKADAWVKCDTGVKSPCPQADGERACGAASPDFDEYHSLVEIPIFQQGSAPYATPKDDGGISVPADKATPIPATRKEKVCAALTVPKGTAPTAGWPIALYAHGTGGSFRSHASDGAAKALSSIDLGGGTKVGFAVLGIDQVQHGPRRGSSTESPNTLFFNFANPKAARWNAVQGAADQHSLVRFVETLTDPAFKIDPTQVVYWGHSQGATEGSIFLAYDATVKGAVLSGEGAGLISALTTKTSPVDIKNSLWFALSESEPGKVSTFHPVLSLLQSWSDPSDPLHYAAIDAVAIGPSGPVGHHLFQPVGASDTFSPPETELTFAAAAFLPRIAPAVINPKDTGLPSVQGNFTVTGTTKVTAAFREYAPSGYDGHFVVFRNDQARTDAMKFLARSARGETPKIPE